VIGIVLAAAGVTAVVDWWSVATDNRRVEAAAKPLVMIWLIAAALLIDADPTSARPWIVAGLIAGLAGDIFLLPNVDKFLAGLGAFLVGHILYFGGLVQIRDGWTAMLIGAVAGVALLAVIGRPIVMAVRGSSYFLPVTVYIGAVGALVVVGVGTGRWVLAAGAVAFALSDGLLGSDRFVKPAPHRRVYIHMLYHVGQAGLVIGLASTFA
jgi:alkenylglycerophosphocholine/alkenylglycerophosphoethanolamine hydrolase